MRRVLLWCARNPWLGEHLPNLPFMRKAVHRFMPGEEIEDALSRRNDDEVESRVIGELIMERLKVRDHVAYVRFASVYRNFQDLDEFYEELRDLTARRVRAAMSEGQAELPFSESS